MLDDVYVSLGQARVLPRKVEKKPECGERPPWPVGPSQTVRRTGRCRGRSPSYCRRHQHRHRRRRPLHHLRPCTASRRPHAPTDLGNPGCTEKQAQNHRLSILYFILSLFCRLSFLSIIILLLPTSAEFRPPRIPIHFDASRSIRRTKNISFSFFAREIRV